MTTEITTTATIEQKLDLIAEATRQAFIARNAQRKAEQERITANRIAREAAVAAGTMTQDEARQAAIADLMAGTQRTPITLICREQTVQPEPENVIESTATVIDDEPEPEPPAPATALVAAIGEMPASFRTNYQRIGYMLSILRSNADEAIAKGAQSLYDGSINTMSKRTSTSTPEAVIATVLERAEAFRVFPAEETAQAWAKSLDPVGLPAIFDDDPDPEPTTPAAAPVPSADELAEATAQYDLWEQRQAALVYAGWQDFERNRESIVAWADWRIIEMCEWDDSDDLADWRAA